MTRRSLPLLALAALLLRAAATAAGARGGIPQRAPEPRTMREFWPVFLGFAATWLAIVAYVLHAGSRIGRAARAARGLEERSDAGA